MWRQLNKVAEKALRPTLCVDIDGTLLESDGSYKAGKFGKPRKDVVDKVRELKKKGIRVVLYTARPQEDQKGIIDHLMKIGLYDLFDEIESGEKPCAFAYLDDKALNCDEEGWQEKMEKLYEVYMDKHDIKKEKVEDD